MVLSNSVSLMARINTYTSFNKKYNCLLPNKLGFHFLEAECRVHALQEFMKIAISAAKALFVSTSQYLRYNNVTLMKASVHEISQCLSFI